MDALVEVLKQAFRPASVGFLVMLLTIGVVLAFIRRTQRAARWYLLALLAFYWAGAAPACAERMVRWESGGYRALASAGEARGARVVVVLGAGNVTIQAGGRTLNMIPRLAALRVLEGARLYALLGQPTIIVSGGVTGHHPGARSEGDAMRTAMIELAVPADHIVVEAESQNTREEADAVARMLSDRVKQPIVLVTSPTHMSRSVAVFRRAGLDVVPSVAAFKPDYSSPRARWWPNDDGLQLFDMVVYDVAANWYYRLRGWMPL